VSINNARRRFDLANRILVFGGYGFVGGVIAQTAVRMGWDVTVAGGSPKPGLTNVKSLSLDITDAAAVRDTIDKVKPDAVVNTVAVSNIDRAEHERELAYAVNVDGARNIAEACHDNDIKYLFFSSDAVFSGNDPIYTETDEPAPVNYYGRTKADAEKAVLTTWPKSIVLRISLVLGFPVTAGNSFIAGLKKKLAQGSQIQCPMDEYRTPIDVHTLAEAVMELLTINFTGLLHIGSTNSINRYDLTRKAAELMGFDTALVTEKKPGLDDHDRAPRHKNGIIDVTRAKALLKTKLLSADETITKAAQSQDDI